MTFLEQIEANNNPNNPDRIKYREALAKMETPKVEETVTVIGQNSKGEDIKKVVDANGETWGLFPNCIF